MSLRPVYGHETILDRLGGAIASGRLPQTALLVGAAGVGKQRLALWVAQALLCEPHQAGRPCERCEACRKVLELTHPDLHWFVPIPRPKATDPAKQVGEVAEALCAVMAERRAHGLWGPPEGMASHPLASVRLLQRVVSLTPFQGRRKVVIVGDAERLVVQEASPEAANAMLKVLEEPPADTVLLLTAADPQALLPTIRSRLVPLRVPRVSDEAVRAFLSRELAPPVTGRALERRTLLAEGAIGRALAADGEQAKPDEAADSLLEAAAQGPRQWLPRALGQAPWSARGDFSAMLDALALRLRARLKGAALGDERRAAATLGVLRRLEDIRADAQGNVNPQLALAVLARELERLP